MVVSKASLVVGKVHSRTELLYHELLYDGVEALVDVAGAEVEVEVVVLLGLGQLKGLRRGLTAIMMALLTLPS